MSEKSLYYQLSDEEKIALKCAIVFPHATLKIVLPELFNSSWSSSLYRRHSIGQEGLKKRGLLNDKGNLTDLAYEILPTEILRKMVKELNSEVKKKQTELSEMELKKFELDHKCKTLETENKELNHVREQFKLIADIIKRFSFLNVDENWISVLICSNLVEQAMKKKLEKLGFEIEEGRVLSFKDVREALGNVLKEKENRKLDALFEPKELWRIRSRMDHWGYKLKFNKDEAQAIFVMTKEIIDQIWHSK